MSLISHHMPDHRSHRLAMSRTSFVIGLILWTLVLGALYSVAVRRIAREKDLEAIVEKQNRLKGVSSQFENDPTGTGIADSLDVGDAVEATTRTAIISFPSRKLPEFEFPECMGGTVSLESMKGKRWLANFIFTRCAGPCPLMTRDVSELHRRVAKANPDFRFVTFTVDPVYDTPEVLKKYAETFQADLQRWSFLTGDETKIHDLIRTGFVLYVQPNLGDLRKPGFEVAHSNRAVLVNEDGIPVGSFIMTVPEDVVRLRRIIEGKVEFPTPVEGGLSLSSGENPVVPFTLVPANPNGNSAVDENTDKNEDKENGCEGENENESNPSDEDGETELGSQESTDEQSTNIEVKDPGFEENKSEAYPIAPIIEPADTPQAKNQRIDQLLPAWAARMPSINAALNSVCIVLLIGGLVAIKAGKKIRHRNLMIAAFLVSTAFLVCYLAYHQVLFQYTQFRGRAFVGSKLATRMYFGILIPHVILAALVPILALRVFYLAFRERWPEHRRLARITFPIWLFVSITGVVIYGMLYHWPWPQATVTMNLAH